MIDNSMCYCHAIADARVSWCHAYSTCSSLHDSIQQSGLFLTSTQSPPCKIMSMHSFVGLPSVTSATHLVHLMKSLDNRLALQRSLADITKAWSGLKHWRRGWGDPLDLNSAGNTFHLTIGRVSQGPTSAFWQYAPLAVSAPNVMNLTVSSNEELTALT